MAYPKIGTWDHIGTLQKPENRDPTKSEKPGPYKNQKTWEPCDTLARPYKNRKIGTQDPRQTGEPESH